MYIAHQNDLTMIKHPLSQQHFLHQIDDLLNVLGEGRIDSVPYDTAWIARLAPHFKGYGFEYALDWLRGHQHADGSWGGDFLHYHDRFISTLAAIITLYENGDERHDAERIHQAETYLWREVGRMRFDADDTIGFPVLAVALTDEAHRLGFDIPLNIYRNAEIIEKKLNYLGSDPTRWRYTSMSFSLEAARAYFPDPAVMRGADFMLENGSVGASPAATAAYMLHSRANDDAALGYLSWLVERQGDGGAPDMNPIDIFEIGWGLLQLRMGNAITPHQPQVRRLLDLLWKLWKPETGVSFSEYFPLPDLDDTAVVYALLRWGGYPVNVEVFGQYEADDHFVCYPNEANPSLSVNIRALAALQMDRGNPKVEAWVEKITRMLRRHDLENSLWFDKWHISPYYLTPVAVTSLVGVIDDLLRARVKWILKTQRRDGGWGYYHQSTVEETAYCLQSLLYWNAHVERVDRAVLDAAAAYIMRTVNKTSRMPALYIGKCLYNPVNVVRSAVIGALYSYSVYRGVR